MSTPDPRAAIAEDGQVDAFIWQVVSVAFRALDEVNGSTPAQITLRTLKIGEELGEAIEACPELPVFATYRMEITADTHLARVVAAWSMTGKVVQPACIAAAGLIASTAGIRTAIGVLSVILLGTGLLLPWPLTRTCATRPGARTEDSPPPSGGRVADPAQADTLTITDRSTPAT